MLHTQEERVNIDAPEIISIVFIHALQRTAVEHSNPFHAQLLQASPDHPQLPLPRHIPGFLLSIFQLIYHCKLRIIASGFISVWLQLAIKCGGT